ncbi:membrane-associated protein [Halovivax gelatinilyticus]|uniref:membrane-associated protein n=1 Tax=Halovivax gelatinilyticus TaxID=2961597 RepID=UPI0020CA5EA2|nr:membrane-associated protein [Halovivax gelatinilyticus]
MQTTLLTVTIAVGFGLFFVGEGLVLGKILQPAVFFVGYVTIVTPPWPALTLVTAASAVGATVGQWMLYRTITPTRPAPGNARLSIGVLSRIPGLIRRWLGHRWVALVERQVDRFGRIGIAVCTALPAVRTVVPIVAGLGVQPERGYVIASGVGNACYMVLLLGAAYGVLGLGRLFVGL